MVRASSMEKLPTGRCTSSGLEVQAMSATVEDIPDDCMELIMKRLDLVDHYKGWQSLIKPYSLRASPFSRHWLLIDPKVVCASCATPGFDGTFDPPDLLVKHHYNLFLLFSDLGQGNAQEILVNLEGLAEIAGSDHRSGRHRQLATDKGLLFVNLHQSIQSMTGNRHDRFLVLNPINNSKSFLPPIPSSLCRCKLPACGCEAIPLQLTVNTEQKGRLKIPLSSSYKAYVLEKKDLPKHCRRNSKVPNNFNFRVTVYDSVTKLWVRTGVEWISTSRHTQIFPMRDGTFYVSTGGDFPYYDSRHHMLYKFQDGILVGKVKAPAKVKASLQNCDSELCLHSSDGCGCISATVFESKGKIFFFQQKSWVGLFGPNCISAVVWELNDREMVWRKLPVFHHQKFQLCSRLQSMMSIILKYEGILLVFRGQGYLSDFCLVAGFDTLKKTWCKVPETLLEDLSRPFRQGHEVNLQPRLSTSVRPWMSGDRTWESLIFEPRVTTRA